MALVQNLVVVNLTVDRALDVHGSKETIFLLGLSLQPIVEISPCYWLPRTWTGGKLRPTSLHSSGIVSTPFLPVGKTWHGIPKRFPVSLGVICQDTPLPWVHAVFQYELLRKAPHILRDNNFVEDGLVLEHRAFLDKAGVEAQTARVLAGCDVADRGTVLKRIRDAVFCSDGLLLRAGVAVVPDDLLLDGGDERAYRLHLLLQNVCRLLLRFVICQTFYFDILAIPILASPAYVLYP